ncbi:MAG TPA: hypothetical protein VJ553_02415 [Candidatus Paceibacterota bacterium]|nr:hypothetical protein [Candidatus Paceibacterota bacterium]
MITGAKFWDDRKYFFSQVNNPSEELLRKTGAVGWLETCGPTAAVTCMAVLGYDLTIRCPGSYQPQPEEVLSDFLNDPRNYLDLAKERADIPPDRLPNNRVPQYYPLAVARVFGAQAFFTWLTDPVNLAKYLTEGRAVQICLEKPGHYLAAIAYDGDQDEVVFNDPWPDQHPDRNGFNRRIARMKLWENQKRFAVVYTGRGT